MGPLQHAGNVLITCWLFSGRHQMSYREDMREITETVDRNVIRLTVHPQSSLRLITRLGYVLTITNTPFPTPLLERVNFHLHIPPWEIGEI
jgi:hypothetical protein